ncbi:uncharacterized protein LOC128995396 [Macrosteles quadrilineatus]|uniref:uncharacterized protein LOC128995396 n=1 Tax=Macrosteles quadrilineatus TaxID=74068 RepID=UPI0023E0B4AF|nr:uncharacterized protein LOC128995396 [Macrosteles quadrilineatus]
MSKQNGTDNIDWLSLAAKMFMTKLNDPTSTLNSRVEKRTHQWLPVTQIQTRPPMHKPRTTVSNRQVPSEMPQDYVDTIRQFEALRCQLLRQLVMYQTQLIAMKMPSIPACYNPATPEAAQKSVTLKGKTQKSSGKNKKQTSVNNGKPGQNEVKKWKKVQNPTKTVKDPVTRRSKIVSKPKKTVTKSSKRKFNQETSNCTQVLDSIKRPCPSYMSCVRNFSSSTDSDDPTKRPKNSYKPNFDLASGESMFLKSSLINALNVMRENSTSVSKLPQRKVSMSKKKITSSLSFDTTTDEGHSSM